MALLAIIVVVLIVLLAWPTHSARLHETGEPPAKWINGDGCANGRHEGRPRCASKLEGGDAHGTRRTGSEYGVFDETGKCVGTVSFDKVPRVGHKSYPTRTIRLFDSKASSTRTWNASPL